MSTDRFVRDEGVAGSNPATPTTLPGFPRPSTDSFTDRNGTAPTCPQCGTSTNHYCGMGACVDLCPKCDRL